jgi:hypothetical protein
MEKSYQNLCIRCGKKRVVVRTWEEKTEYSTVINTEMACPDPECQKQVEKQNQKQVDKFHLMNRKSEERRKKRISENLKKRAKNKKKA